MSDETQKIRGVRPGMPVTYRHVKEAMQGIHRGLRENDKEKCRKYAADLLQYLSYLNILPEETK